MSAGQEYETSASRYARLPATDGLRAVVALATRISGCPHAAITVVDGAHQFTVATYGIAAGDVVSVANAVGPAVTVRRSTVVIGNVDDAFHAPDIAHLVRNAGFSAYVGIPLPNRDDLPAATLCVLDTRGHHSGDLDIAALQLCAVLAGDALIAAETEHRDQIYDTSSGDAALTISDVSDAMDAGQIVPWYMPIVDLRTGTTVAVEALARWIHPTHGMLPPDRFIPLVERDGDAMIRFDLAMMKLALADLQNWRRTRFDADSMSVAINFSAHHFYRPNCVDRINAVTTAAGVEPSCVMLEITETVAVPTTSLINAHVIDDLKACGYVLAFDDIGGDWLPAQHLMSLAVDGLKADRSVGSALHTPQGRAVARALTSLTTELGQFLVIEGIETHEQAHQARMTGAQLGQGYFWSPPRPADEFPMATRPAA